MWRSRKTSVTKNALFVNKQISACAGMNPQNFRKTWQWGLPASRNYWKCDHTRDVPVIGDQRMPLQHFLGNIPSSLFCKFPTLALTFWVSICLRLGGWFLLRNLTFPQDVITKTCFLVSMAKLKSRRHHFRKIQSGSIEVGSSKMGSFLAQLEFFVSRTCYCEILPI